MPIQHDEFLWFYKILENSGVKYRSYSGRFMYGKMCLGIVCEDAIQAIGQLLIEITDGIYTSEKREEDVQTFAEWLLRAKTDSMGMSQILYFPSVPWIDEIESEDENEECSECLGKGRDNDDYDCEECFGVGKSIK